MPSRRYNARYVVAADQVTLDISQNYAAAFVHTVDRSITSISWLRQGGRTTKHRPAGRATSLASLRYQYLVYHKNGMIPQTAASFRGSYVVEKLILKHLDVPMKQKQQLVMYQ